MDITLSPEHKSSLQPYIQSFLRYLKTEASVKDQEERLRRVGYFRDELPDKLDSLSETDVAQLVGQLWATQMWGNKQYLAQKVIDDNGLDRLREELRHLMDRSLLPQARYERALTSIRWLGPASITEMLCCSDPQRCGIWNQLARRAVKKLGLDSFVPHEKYKLSGTEYQRLNTLLSAIGGELQAARVPDVDLLIVNSFLYEVSGGQVSEGSKPATETDKLHGPLLWDHDEVRDLIVSIGTMLGFDARMEVHIAHGATVDAIWRARIGNLGTVTYVFEVHKSGSIDSLLLNLQKAKSGSTVQKVIAVSDSVQLQKIEKETSGLPEEFRGSLTFWSVADVQAVAENLRLANEIINRLGLVPGI